MTFLISLFAALASIKALAGYADEFASAVTLWYIQKQNAQTLSQIADAAALAARAQTDEERYASALAWQSALARGRVSS